MGQPVTPPLRHKGDVLSAEFSPDGRRVTTTSSYHTARVWGVGPDERPSGDLMALAELLSGQRLENTDGVFNLTADEWRAR